MHILGNFRGVVGLVVLGICLLLYSVPAIIGRLKRSADHLSRSGQYERALRLNRIGLKIPGYGKSLEGIILFNAGRYSEARVFLKPLAFDAQGKPRPASIELYCYALALENDGHLTKAEELLEAAVNACPNKSELKVALATCLLTQEKEPDRACKLLEQAMATPQETGSAYGRRADDAARTARYAWALAAAGRRDEGEMKIQEATTLAQGLNDFEMAGVQYFSGQAWRTLGETTKARAAYDEALKLSPQGVVALSVKKAQAKLGDTWHAWSS